jgi:soluble lytic murein transglycosylase-like protein
MVPGQGRAMTGIVAFALAAGRPLALVLLVATSAQRAGVDPALAVAVVEVESQYTVNAYREEWNGSNSFGLFQINSQWHPQYRNNLVAHCDYGARYLAECIAREVDWETALTYYNSGYRDSPAGRRYAVKVLRLYLSIKGGGE